MKKLSCIASAAMLLAWSAAAQPDGGPGPDQPLGDGPPRGDSQGPPGRGRHRHPMPLIVKALDANGDGVIDASEIANASAALLKLDKNGDGKLTRDEYIGPWATNAPPPGADGHGPPPIPLVTALDANGDGVIDASEIANASAALLKLDKNGDGQLTRNEYLPPRPPPPDGGPGGPDGAGGPPGGGPPPDGNGPPGGPPPDGDKPPSQ